MAKRGSTSVMIVSIDIPNFEALFRKSIYMYYFNSRPQRSCNSLTCTTVQSWIVKPT